MTPIMDDEEGNRVEYQIPKKLRDRIPDYFYTAFAGELFSVFGWERTKDMFYPEESKEYVDLASSTNGWALAFMGTCEKLDMNWLYDYYLTLTWYDSDVFDGIIEQEMGKRFMNEKGDDANDYYQYLLERNNGRGRKWKKKN